MTAIITVSVFVPGMSQADEAPPPESRRAKMNPAFLKSVQLGNEQRRLPYPSRPSAICTVLVSPVLLAVSPDLDVARQLAAPGP
jgi:hypothetical protein